MSIPVLLTSIKSMRPDSAIRFGNELVVRACISGRKNPYWQIERTGYGVILNARAAWRVVAYLIVWIDPTTGLDRPTPQPNMATCERSLSGPMYSGRKPAPRGRAGNIIKAKSFRNDLGIKD